MPSFADSIFLFVLALLLFGPKKLPVLARELGKWMGEFRRASNEFKMQMEDELRASEQAERQKQVAAMEAAAPIPPPLGEPAEPEHPHLRNQASEESTADSNNPHSGDNERPDRSFGTGEHSESTASTPLDGPEPPPSTTTSNDEETRPVPIATSGSLRMMPPATGLPTPRSSRPGALSGLVDSIPEASQDNSATATDPHSESVAHGD